jgi:hypothetical protein
MTAVVSFPAAHGQACSVLPEVVRDVVIVRDRAYVIYSVSRRERDEVFVDPIDGALLIALNYFDTEIAARRWIAAQVEVV